MADIEDTFEVFARALRGARFDLPVDPTAWPAELIAAHLIVSNDLLTEAARAVYAGREPVYDNGLASDGEALRELLIRTGSLPELADEVERSASDLRAAYGMLDRAQQQTAIGTRICQNGDLVSDRARPLGELVEHNAGPHLESHLVQLLELRY